MVADARTQGTERTPQDTPVAHAERELRKVGAIRALTAELVGAFALTTVDAGGTMIAALTPNVSFAARAAAAGLTILAFTYAVSSLSGAHFNPAVSFAFAARRVFPWRAVPFYVAAQTVGAVLAALFLRATFGPVAQVGATNPSPPFDATSALAMEVVLTFFLVQVILGTAHSHKVIGPHATIASGAAVALCGLFAKPVSGASMNPARSFGSALVGGSLDTMWIYVIGPLLGAALAVVMTRLLHPTPRMDESGAATGDDYSR